MTDLRPCWRNCALTPDPEISAIDALEDRLTPLTPDAVRIRELISSLELCHHKADRWVANIIEAIGSGTTSKAMGTRPIGQRHPAEIVWQNAIAALTRWVTGKANDTRNLTVVTVPAKQLTDPLGAPTPLKTWQVQLVIEKIRSVADLPQTDDDSSMVYEWLLLGGDEYDPAYRTRCPECYKDNENFWLQTVRTFIRDTEGGDDTELSLGLAIDMLWPCHWRFVSNLQIVLAAIGGKLHTDTPFAACGRNITLLPIRSEMEAVCTALRHFWKPGEADAEPDAALLAKLGEPTDSKKWLAASLEKTIHLQLDPPTELRAISALAGPEWLRQ